MLNWLDSIYSDGTKTFVSDPAPRIGDTVEIRIRFLKEAPVEHVMVMSLPDGLERYDEAFPTKEEHGLVYYTARVPVTEYRLCYYFCLAAKDTVYFYTQNGVTTYIPDHTYDFRLRTDFRKPSWADGAVMYQIFPERFANGDPSNDVQDGEFEYRGNKPVHRNWDDIPYTYDEAKSLDFFGGDLDGIREKLPYLQDLGVTVLYLNPVFAAYSNHKYDCIDYEHVDPHFGGDEALERLCRAVHDAGMKIILDISINHTGIEHKWVKEGRPYYFRQEDGYLQCWLGVDTLPTLNYTSMELRDKVWREKHSVLRKWLQPPYCIDGWRFDVADVFARNGRVQVADECWKELCAAIREENPDAMIIAEEWGDKAEYLQGDLWTTPMNYFGFGRVIRQFAGLGDPFLNRQPLLGGVHYTMTAKDAAARAREHYAKIPQFLADCQMNLFDSHDIPRMHNFDSIGFEKWKSAVVAQLLWPGIPCIYYGDERAIGGYTYHDHGFRYPMPWNEPDEEGKKHYVTIKTMTGLRRTVGAFASGSAQLLYAEGRILAIARFDGERTYAGIISMEEEERTIDLPLGLAGAFGPKSGTDVFGSKIRGEVIREDGTASGTFRMQVPALASFLFECELMA